MFRGSLRPRASIIVSRHGVTNHVSADDQLEHLASLPTFPCLTMSCPQLDNVAVHVESDAIAVLKLNRPAALNALNTSLLKDLLAALQWAENEAAIRVVVLSGEGRTLTVGLDLLDQDVQGEDAMVSDAFVDALSSVQESLINSNKIIISAVKGPAPGWGTSSLALSDLVYATSDACFSTPFVKWGLCAEACSSQTLMRTMGRQRASALILAGAKMTAHDLKLSGLVTEIFDNDGFMESVLGVARSILQLPNEALTANKKLMMAGTREMLLETNRREMIEFRRLARGKECREAVAAFTASQDRKKQGKHSKI
jgi:peroxisomal 3,2-trans-enoyl-CoA isomerase